MNRSTLSLVAVISGSLWFSACKEVGKYPCTTENPCLKGRVCGKQQQCVTAEEFKISTANLPVCVIGVEFNIQLEAAGGISPYHAWTLEAAPTWLQIEPNTGLLSGIPDAITTGTEVTVSVRDNAYGDGQQVKADFLLVVTGCDDGDAQDCFIPVDVTCQVGTQTCQGSTWTKCESAGPSDDVNHCGAGCEACDPQIADRCDGACRCGNNPSCGSSEHCCANGCTNLSTDAANCGVCGKVCSAQVQHATGLLCTSNACDYTTCEIGFFDYNQDRTDGCEYADELISKRNCADGIDNDSDGMTDDNDPGCVPVFSEVLVADDAVNALAEANGKLFIGGEFALLGPRSGNLLIIDAISGELKADWPEVDGWLKAVAPDGAGGFFFEGTRSIDGYEEEYGLQHILPDGTTDHLWSNGVPDGTVEAIHCSPSFVFVGGNAGLTVYNRQTGAWMDRYPVGDGTVFSIVGDDSTVYLGGSFSSVGGLERHNLAAIDISSGRPTNWNPIADDGVKTIVVDGSSIFVGGYFTTINGVARQHLAELESTTGSPTTWDPDLDGPVFSLLVKNDTVYAGGFFNGVGADVRANLAAIDKSTGLVTSWVSSPSFQGMVMSIAATDTLLFLGGSFSAESGNDRANLASVDLSSGNATEWDLDLNGQVAAIAIGGSNLAVIGNFTGASALRKEHLSAIDLETQTLVDWDLACDGSVSAIVVNGSNVYLGGSFRQVAGQLRTNLANIDSLTGQTTTWNPGTNGVVKSLALSGDALYAGGEFTAVGGQARSALAAVHTLTGEILPWDPGSDGQVLAIAAADSVIYVGGIFTHVGGQDRPFLAALDPATGQATSWAPATDGPVHVIKPIGSTIYIGGKFTTVDDKARTFTAAIDAQTGEVLDWAPTIADIPQDYIDDGVFAFEIIEPYVMIGGSFQIDSQDSAIALVERSTGRIADWRPFSMFAQVYALHLSGSDLYLSGSFNKFDSWAQSNIARYSLP